MKKFLLRAAFVIIVLLLIFKGILMYRDYTSYQRVIHEDVDKVIKISVDAIGKSMAYNAMKHPIYYYHLRNRERDTIEDKKSPGKGFSLPANIFLYTIKGKNKTTFFTSFRISDTANFRAFLKTENFSEFHDFKNIQIASKNADKLSVAFNDDQCVIVYNPTKENVDDIFIDLLLNKKFLQEDASIYKQIKSADAHLSYLSSTDNLSVNFKDGKIKLSGFLSLPSGTEMPSEPALPEFSKESSMRFYLNLKTSEHFDSFTLNDITIEPDSISKYLHGHFMMEVAGITQQQDTIITYDYNDDFEKVAVSTLSAKEVPKINVNLSASSKHLLAYLENAGMVNEGRLNRKLLPLYQFKVDTTARGFQLSTNLSKKIKSKITDHKAVFGLDIDFVKLQQQQDFIWIQPYLKKAIDLKIKGELELENMISVAGELQLENEEINAMTQLIF